MRFRHLIAACIAVLAIVLTPTPPTPAQAQGNTSMFNCAMLSGTPFMCLKNESVAPIVAVQAVAPGYGWFNPTAWIMVPGGGIQPGGAAVIKFPVFSHGAVQNIVIRTADSQVHYMWNVNVVANTSLTIRW
jgi:hypothetical protein